MKKFIMWFADIFNVELTKTVTVEKEVEKIVYKIVPAEGKIAGDVIIEGDVEVQGGLLIAGGISVGTYIAAREGASLIWGQKFDGTASIASKNVLTVKSEKHGK